MKQNTFSKLVTELESSPKDAILSDLSILPNALRGHINNLLSKEFVGNEKMLATPVFEPMFGWMPADKQFKDLCPDLLPTSFVNVLDSAVDYGFKKDMHPYTHQIQAWDTLLNTKQSLVVSSGTGSGKTESFMIPIISDMIKQVEQSDTVLEGVQALFLYPLNALIQNQKERFRAWTRPYNGKIRYCLYNGLLPEAKPEHETHKTPEEIIDRKHLWQSPPPLLITNSTMLEYMLIRKKDSNILNASQGKLKYIVLDEAHTYIGSQAAELALLLRRVLDAFGVDKQNVRFIATSATIGSSDAKDQLKKFLSSIAGIPEKDVTVVFGKRFIANYDGDPSNIETLETLESLDQDALLPALSKHYLACQMRNYFIDASNTKALVRDLKEFCEHFGLTEEIALRWLDVLSSNSEFLPLRIHLFHKTFPGIWCCCNEHCTHKPNIENWKYGKLYLSERYACDCGAPVFKLGACNTCGTVFLDAQHIIHEKYNKIVPNVAYNRDDFQLEDEFNDNTEDDNALKTGKQILICNDKPDRIVFIDKNSGEYKTEHFDNSIAIGLKEKNVKKCPVCSMADISFPFQGAPFFLSVILPSLLSYADPKKDAQNLPAGGRNMICFTDSRQGTAKTAVKLQQNAENNAFRSLLLNIVAKNKDQATFSNFDLSNLPPELRNLLQQKINGTAYKDAKSALIQQQLNELNWIQKYYVSKGADLFLSSDGLGKLIDIMFWREFARRPKKAINLETLGIMRLDYDFTAISGVPNSVSRYFDLAEWKSFLKIIMDFFVRANGCVEYPEGWAEWGATFQNNTWIEPIGTISTSKYAKAFPSVKKAQDVRQQPNIIRLLSVALNLDLPNPVNEDIIDSIMGCAWNDLTRTGVLSSNANMQYRLNLSTVNLALNDKIYKCPITKRPLDTILKNTTPYVVDSRTAKCEEFIMPRYDFVGENGLTNAAAQERRKEWLKTNSGLTKLKENGLWSNIANKVIQGDNYYRTAEHSAQQDSYKLQEYEAFFKEGKVNILNCSTTMEMGIDIGGLSIVAMNNVPPHPANYLQRAGRAGRRKEPKAIAMTTCKNNSHEDYVFANPKWAFETQINAPYVDMFSRLILQRHINSMLLAAFFKAPTEDIKDGTTLNMQWLMLPEDNNKLDEFKAFCKKAPENDQLCTSLTKLIDKTHFANIPLTNFTEELVKKLDNFHKDWFMEYNAILNQLASLEGQEVAAQKSLENQKSRLEKEYILKELIEAGILPRYGFPINLVTFNTHNMISANKKRQSIDREDNPFRRQQLPTRDMATAIREYAPGADIVIDGLVYKSSGITLNWHIPTTDTEVKEIQSIRFIWRCKHCGASGSSHSNHDIKCPQCDQIIAPQDTTRYIQPAGFSVDYSDKPHNSVINDNYVTYYEPLVSINKKFTKFDNNDMLWYRSDDASSLIHYSKGNGLGYDLCLACGRMTAKDSLKDNHKRLRTGTDCNHSDFSILRGIGLGLDTTTDALEILLVDLDGKYIKDEVVAYTLAVAIRAAVAQFMGVELDEIGCAIKEVRTPTNLGTCQSIILFDNNTAGYCSSGCIIENLPRILKNAKQMLLCDCKTCCNKCLLQHDTKFKVDFLDRTQGLNWLTDVWLKKLSS